MRTKYRIDDFQQTYFVIEIFDDLLRQTLETDFSPLYVEVSSLIDLEVDTVTADDKVFTRGTQAYSTAKLGASSPVTSNL